MKLFRFFLVPLTAGALLAAEDDLSREVKRLVDAYAVAESYSAEPVNPEQAFYQGAIPGLLRRLDPHSVFFDPAQFEQLKQMQNSTTKGFGSVVSILPGRVIVLQALPGTPSARSGIAPGDEILAVNNFRLDRLNLEQLVELLGESRQKPARLDVRRSGNARLLQFTLTPEEMQSPSVERAFLLKPGVAYLRVGSFEEKTGAQIKEGIEQLGGAKLSGLVLDLRNNPGGLLTAAIETASLFLKPEQTVLTIKGRNVKEKEEKVPSGAQPYSFPVAILINAKSASASEIVAGALQDHDRATVLGEPSYGKGLVQSVFPLSGSTGIALTTALYYTPSGRSIQKPLKDQGDQFALSATTKHPNIRADFKSDKGRQLQGGGGILPDILITQPELSRLRVALEGSGSFPSFATEYLKQHKVDASFEVTPQLLDSFREYLNERQIQPGLGEWSRERDFIQNRLRSEIFNQGLGVEKGDEVEAQRDPGIQKALEILR
ncbi:MAG: S41 family peptidase [Acidobacteriota bacterium]|nr:S41 family peptidase [Acidobacteriota bacterium]